MLVFARRPVLPQPAGTTGCRSPSSLLLLVLIRRRPRTAGCCSPPICWLFFVAPWSATGAGARPARRRQLTEFYLCLSVGGVLGGAFNGLLAPVLFRGIAEYPIALVLACLAVPAKEKGKKEKGKSDKGAVDRPGSRGRRHSTWPCRWRWPC